jgi:MoaA/NifB/PqqE/SkfB family radical SAM enzyme
MADAVSALPVPSETELNRYVMPPPQCIGLEVTQRCNLQCPMCYQHARLPHSVFVGRDMKLDIVDLLAPVLQTAHEVSLAGGGEPMMLPYFFDFVDKCHEYNPDIRVTAISNGVLLTERRALMAVEKRVHTIEVSMDGTIQYGHVGGGADYDQVQDRLRRLARLREEYGVEEPHINIAFVAMRDNLCELPDLIEFAGEISAKVRIQPLSPVSEEQRNQNVFRHMDYTLRVLGKCREKAQQLGVELEHKNLTDNLTQTPHKCQVPDRWLWVSFDGELRPCCGGLTTGRNIYEKNLSAAEVWNAPYLRRLRWELDTGNYNDTCRHCPLLWNTLEGQERAIQSDPLEERVVQLEAHLEAIRRGRVMRILRMVDRLLGRE